MIKVRGASSSLYKVDIVDFSFVSSEKFKTDIVELKDILENSTS